MALFALVHSRSPFSFRSIRAYLRTRRAVNLVVEDGTRLHISLGSSSLLSQAGASALAGLSMLRQMSEVTSLSDRPPMATDGNGALNLTAQDTLRAAHQAVTVDQHFDINSGRVTGLTPFSYIAGVMPTIRDEGISTNVLIGNFGPEIGLLTDAAERQNSISVAASDSLPAQAVIYAATTDPLIGEELYAAGAYNESGPTHAASLVTQDVLRWVIILALLGGAIFKLAGL